MNHFIDLIDFYVFPFRMLMVLGLVFYLLMFQNLYIAGGTIMTRAEVCAHEYYEILRGINWSVDEAELQQIHDRELQDFMMFYAGRVKDYDKYYDKIISTMARRMLEVLVDDINDRKKEQGIKYILQIKRA